MEEKAVQSWDKVPSVTHLMIRAKRIIYAPLCHATLHQPEVHCFVDEQDPNLADGPTKWLSRQPFRYVLYLFRET